MARMTRTALLASHPARVVARLLAAAVVLAAAPDARELVTDVLDGRGHPLGRLRIQAFEVADIHGPAG